MARQIITALFDDLTTAQSALSDLVNAGIQRDDISLVAADSTGDYARRINSTDVIDEDVKGGEGAGFGAVVGALVGLGAMAIPGIGPIIAAGPIAAALIGAGVGAAAGAVTGGITASLVDMGVDTATATYYEEGLRRGGTLVIVNTDDAQVNKVISSLNSHNPTDLDTKVSEWQRSGWAGYSGSDTVDTVGSARASTPGVRVHNYVVPNTTTASSRGLTTAFADYDSDFRSHYKQAFTSAGNDYDYYIPAYEYGYRLANDDRYLDYDWNTIETAARQNWENNNPGTWEEVKAAVSHAWKQVKASFR